MKVWFDTEFIEDGITIDLISIGMVREDGRTLYLESSECELSRASEWVRENVIPHLKGARTPRKEMRSAIVEFSGDAPEFWAYYSSYDWVALCQLHGTMMDLPRNWPMFCRDVKQWMDQAGIDRIPVQQGQEHHALADAIWLKSAHEWLEGRTEQLARS